MDVQLSEKCFISHAYADIESRNRLIKSLPSHVEAVVFPRITVPSDELVSSELVEALLDCDGLIYLSGGASDRSFWVAFERDYALRAEKKVYAADIDSMQLREDVGPPLDLAVFASYHREDAPRVREIVEFLNRERHSDVPLDIKDLRPGTSILHETERSIQDRLARGGYALIFWSEAASHSPWVESELEAAAEGMPDFNDRVLFALLEDVPLPRFWLMFQEPAVQLFGDAERSEVQRLDDLTVRLYWLIYRKTRQREL
jgi:hypothetical protein